MQLKLRVCVFIERQDSSVLYRASHLADVDYLLIHGTGDGKLQKILSFTPLDIFLYSCPCYTDNVHFQNTAQLVEALTEANVLFDMQVSSSLDIVVVSAHFS